MPAIHSNGVEIILDEDEIFDYIAEHMTADISGPLYKALSLEPTKDAHAVVYDKVNTMYYVLLKLSGVSDDRGLILLASRQKDLIISKLEKASYAAEDLADKTAILKLRGEVRDSIKNVENYAKLPETDIISGPEEIDDTE